MLLFLKFDITISLITVTKIINTENSVALFFYLRTFSQTIDCICFENSNLRLYLSVDFDIYVKQNEMEAHFSTAFL